MTGHGYLALLRQREFAGLYTGFTLLAGAGTLSGFALGTLVRARTGAPFLTAVSMYGSSFTAVLGALTLMSLADGARPRRTLVALHLLALAATLAQAVPGLPLAARFALLLGVGLFQSLGTGTRMGLLAEIVPPDGYAPARSLMNVTAGGASVLGFALGGALLTVLTPYQLLGAAAGLTALAALVVAATVRERSVRPPRRPGLRETWRGNVELLGRPGRRALLLNLWVPNGLVVGCEALFLLYAPAAAGTLLAASSAGMLVGDLVVGRLLDAARRARLAYGLRLLLAGPFLLLAARPPVWAAALAVGVAGVGFAATLPLQERLLALTPQAVRGQVQGVESAGRIAWQGVGAALAGTLAQLVEVRWAIGALAAVSLLVTVVSRPAVVREAAVAVRPGVPGTVAAGGM
ncbi:MFS transporter [Kitasatospora cineracea]|uniref:Putative MFS family arabinose efflux permease n=1 Tax=Kitasatospora cineracea TaxID=88074 RepID=A0A8G1UPK0_9ACTN|nr:MFS transporter [Kitasatospora cineracea]ROR45414.1 putative MFS family arabinose efflux permease [Kitasatospora cineracea]